jgi:hypothetical protein
MSTNDLAQIVRDSHLGSTATAGTQIELGFPWVPLRGERPERWPESFRMLAAGIDAAEVANQAVRWRAHRGGLRVVAVPDAEYWTFDHVLDGLSHAIGHGRDTGCRA